MEKKQIINCDVKECRFNNQKDNLCKLHRIMVSTNLDNCNSKEKTICDSFKTEK